MRAELQAGLELACLDRHPEAHRRPGLKTTLGDAVCSLAIGYEVLRYREHRIRVRQPELAG